MSKQKASHPWLPPQRDPGQSTRNYVAVLSRHMRALRRIFEDPHNGHDLRQRSRNRFDKCLELRDKAELGER